MHLPEGILISHDFDTPVKYILQAQYIQSCYMDSAPMLNTNINLVLNKFSDNLPLVKHSWDEYTQNSSSGGFMSSVAPMIYSIALLAVVTWFLTIFVIANYTVKPSHLLKTSVVFASAYMLVTVVKSIVVLHKMQKQGFLHGHLLLQSINNTVYLQIIDLIVTFLLHINQVQVLMRLFLRQSDKRQVFLCGLMTSVASQTLWSISKFHKFGDKVEAAEIIPVFTYLIRIAMSITYAAIFTAFVLTKSKTIYHHKSLWAISVLSLLFIEAPVAFFIADLSQSWIYLLAEVYSVVTYVVCVVIPWEWCNKFYLIQKVQEEEGILGRRFYEDEVMELDRFDLFVEEESDLSPSQSLRRHSNDNASSPGHDKVQNTSTKPIRDDDPAADRVYPSRSFNLPAMRLFTNGYNRMRDGCIKITDFVIATGLAIPRSVSARSSFENHGTRGADINTHVLNEVPQAYMPDGGLPGASAADSNTRRDRDVYVYATKAVRVDFDED